MNTTEPDETAPPRSFPTLYQEFEKLVAELLRLEGLIDDGRKYDVQFRPDFVVRTGAGLRLAVEVKLTRSRTAPRGMLAQAAGLLSLARTSVQADSAILVVGALVDSAVKEALRVDFPSILLFDLRVLYGLSAKHPMFLHALDEIIREATPFSDQSTIDGSQIDLDRELAERGVLDKREDNANEQAKAIKRGASLCEQVRAVPAGKRGAIAFEEAVSGALRYVFDGDLAVWSRQRSTDTGMSRYDMVCRISSPHDFWQTILIHFQSLYVVFEFKNYSGKIKQGQILTTEKYLHRPARRATAIVIARSGADENATKVAKGALREAGKLIMLLTVDDLCQMLSLRDRGEDHNAVLVDRLDEFLVSLER